MTTSIKKWALTGSLLGLALVLLDSMFLEKYFFAIKRFKIGNKGSGKKIKLLLITDLHFQKTLWPFYKKLAHKINLINPHLLMIAGDTLDSSGTPRPADKFLNLINSKIAKAAIPGNHDHLADVSMKELKDLFKKHNCNLLINESKHYYFKQCKLTVTGLDDFIEGNASFDKAVENIGREDHHILLIHSPLQQEQVLRKIKKINLVRIEDEQINITYIFAGHNHGGQVRLFNFIPILPKKSGNYIEGWYNQEKPFLYLSKGFGTSGVPFRFMARSELTVFDYYI